MPVRKTASPQNQICSSCNITKPKRAKQADAAAVQVVRDSTFHRAVVDTASISEVGKDLEIACLQAGRDVQSIRAQGEFSISETVDTLTEVVRLRLSWSTATTLAMTILANGIRTDRLNGSAILEDLARLSTKGADDDK